MAKTTGTRYVADTLRGYGVTHVFFVPQMLLQTLTAMEGMGIRRMMTMAKKPLHTWPTVTRALPISQVFAWRSMWGRPTSLRVCVMHTLPVRR